MIYSKRYNEKLSRKENFERLIKDIENLAESGHLFSATSLLMTLIDIMGKVSNLGFKEWFNEWSIGFQEKWEQEESDGMLRINGEIVYEMRNALLHAATNKITKENYNNCEINVYYGSLVCENGFSTLIVNENTKEEKKILEINLKSLIYMTIYAAKKYFEKNPNCFDDYNQSEILNFIVK